MKSKFYHKSTKIGIVLSLLCAVHCIMMPFIMIAFPFLSDSILHNPIIEWSVLGTLIFLGVFSLNHYRKKHHESILPMIVFTLGVLICFVSLVSSHHLHHTLMMIGAIVIAVSQIMNLTIRRTVPSLKVQS